MQAGKETQRHVASLYDEYNADSGEGKMRWVCRRIIEEYSSWKAARSRMKECSALEAFALILRAARVQIAVELRNQADAAVQKCRELLILQASGSIEALQEK